MADLLQLEVLGALRVRRGDVDVPVTSERQRAVLACLLVHRRPVSSAVLIEAAWGAARLPARPEAALHTVVSRLRALLTPQALVIRGSAGYLLELTDAVTVDAHAFDHLVATAAGSVDPAAETRCLQDALALWRGRAWEGLEDVPAVRGEAARLEDARLAATERLGALLTAGGSAHVAVGLLRDLVDEHPFWESARAGLMRSLHQAGRLAEALDAYHDYRERLVDELGLDPSPAMVGLHRRILTNQLPPTWSAAAGEDEPRSLMAPSALPFVGRESDALVLRAALRASRFVTLFGAGGVGKTRLVAEVVPDVADELGRRLMTVDCDRLSAPDDLRAAVAVALGVPAHGRELLARLGASCEAVRTLLVLDGCEQVASSAAGLVQDLLVHSPSLRIVATSRVPLGSSQEHVVRLAPLPVPITTGSADDAAVLLEAAARRAHPDFTLTVEDQAVVSDVCRRLEGLPLAIELAGARAATIGLAALRDRLADGPEVVDDRSAHHRRSLQGVLEWTYQSLEDDAAELLAHLAVAAGPIDLRLAESLAPSSPDGRVAAALDELVHGSLLVAVSGPPQPSYRILELIRRFVRSRLTEVDLRHTERALVEWALDLAAEAIPGALGPHDRRTLDQVDAHAANLEQALRLARHQWPDDADTLAGRLGVISSHRMPLQLLEPIWQVGRTPATSRTPATWLRTRCRSPVCTPAGPGTRRPGATSSSPPPDRLWSPTAPTRTRPSRCWPRTPTTSRQRGARPRPPARWRRPAARAPTAPSPPTPPARRPCVEALATTALASLLVRRGDDGAGALRLALTHWRQAGVWPQIWTTVRLVAERCVQRDDHETALLLLEAAGRHPLAPVMTGRDADREQRLRATARSRLDDDSTARIDELAGVLPPASVIERALDACAREAPRRRA